MTQAPATTISGTDVRLGAPDGDQPGWSASTLPVDPLAGLGLQGVEDQLSPSDICPLGSWAGAPPPPTLSGMSLPATPPPPRQRKWLGGGESDREREKEAPPSSNSIGQPLDPDWLGGGLLLSVLLGVVVCPSTVGGWCISFSGEVYVFISLAKLGWE